MTTEPTTDPDVPREGDSTRPRSRLRVRLVAVVIALFASFWIAEALVRTVAPVQYMSDVDMSIAQRALLHRPSALEGLSYELRPGAVGSDGVADVAINEAGMRDRAPVPDGTDGLVRVAAIGDSYTFGHFVPMSQAYPSVLERALQGADRTHVYDVLNMGVGGYCTRDEAVVVEHALERWEPHAVLVGYVLNDPETDPVQPLHVYFEDRPLWKSSHLLRLFAQMNERRRVAAAGGDYFRYLHAPEGEKWQSVLDGFARMGAASRRHDVPVAIVLFPFIAEPRWEIYPYRDLHEQVASAATSAGLGVIDLVDAFEQHRPATLCVSPNDAHPSPLAHRVAAEAIRAHLATEHDDVFTSR